MPSANDVLNVAVIGLGIGAVHVDHYQKARRARLVAICDNDEHWLTHCQERWSVPKAYTDHRELLADAEIDAVSVCLPTHLHRSVTLDALSAGKHTLCEKPPAMNSAEVQAMIEAARLGGKTLMFSMNQRFTPEAQFLKRYIEDGHLGEVYFIRSGWRRALDCMPPPMRFRAGKPYTGCNWFNERSKGGGAVRDLGSHMIDKALWFMGHPAITQVVGNVYCQFGPDFMRRIGSDATFDVDDHGAGYAQTATGGAFEVELSYGSFVEQEAVYTEVHGTKGGASIRNGLKLFSLHNGSVINSALRHYEGAVETAQEHFVNCIIDGTTPIVLPEHGLAAMQVIDAIYASGGWNR